MTYNTVIRAFAMEKDLESACGVLAEMQACGVMPNVVTYNTVCHACVQLGEYARAWQLVEDMRA